QRYPLDAPVTDQRKRGGPQPLADRAPWLAGHTIRFLPRGQTFADANFAWTPWASSRRPQPTTPVLRKQARLPRRSKKNGLADAGNAVFGPNSRLVVRVNTYVSSCFAC